MQKLIILFYLLGACALGINAQVATSSSTSKKVVKGVVYDETRSPIAGATVLIKNSTNGYITDSEGKFTLSVSAGDILVVRFFGYQEQEVRLSNSDFLEVNLVPKKDAMKEITVVGFAKQKKESVICSITTVKPSELKDGYSTNQKIETALLSKIADNHWSEANRNI